MRPWRPVGEMDHDEIKRYSQELLARWKLSPIDDSELMAYVREAALRMEKLGVERTPGAVDAHRSE